MLVLALDTSTPAVTAGLVRLPAQGPPQLLAEQVTENARAHGELLTPSVLVVLDQAGYSFADLDAVVCGAGPGPFTGLRVGLVTAGSLADATGVPAYPVCGLDAIAASVLDVAVADADGDLLVATDARRREVYWARYRDGVRVEGPAVAAPDAVPLAGVGRAAGTCAALLAGVPTVVEPRFPTVVGLVAVAADALRTGAEPDPLVPLYLRRPDAVPGVRKRVSP